MIKLIVAIIVLIITTSCINKIVTTSAEVAPGETVLNDGVPCTSSPKGIPINMALPAQKAENIEIIKVCVKEMKAPVASYQCIDIEGGKPTTQNGTTFDLASDGINPDGIPFYNDGEKKIDIKFVYNFMDNDGTNHAEFSEGIIVLDQTPPTVNFSMSRDAMNGSFKIKIEKDSYKDNIGGCGTNKAPFRVKVNNDYLSDWSNAQDFTFNATENDLVQFEARDIVKKTRAIKLPLFPKWALKQEATNFKPAADYAYAETSHRIQFYKNADCSEPLKNEVNVSPINGNAIIPLPKYTANDQDYPELDNNAYFTYRIIGKDEKDEEVLFSSVCSSETIEDLFGGVFNIESILDQSTIKIKITSNSYLDAATQKLYTKAKSLAFNIENNSQEFQVVSICPGLEYACTTPASTGYPTYRNHCNKFKPAIHRHTGCCTRYFRNRCLITSTRL